MGGERSDRSEPRWLTEREQVAWRAWLEGATLLLERLDADLRCDAGMSHADFEILVRLSEADGGHLRMSELAGRALFSRSRLSHAVARLESAGWVRREPCPTDRRGTVAVLTPAGAEVLGRAAAGHVASVRRHLFDHLAGDDVDALGRLGATIADAVRGDRTADVPCATDRAADVPCTTDRAADEPCAPSGRAGDPCATGPSGGPPDADHRPGADA